MFKLFVTCTIFFSSFIFLNNGGGVSSGFGFTNKEACENAILSIPCDIPPGEYECNCNCAKEEKSPTNVVCACSVKYQCKPIKSYFTRNECNEEKLF